jgi:hypothetical protein
MEVCNTKPFQKHLTPKQNEVSIVTKEHVTTGETLGQIFPTWQSKNKKIQCNSCKGFLWKRMHQCHQILRNFYSEITMCRQFIPAGHQHIAGFLKTKLNH